MLIVYKDDYFQYLFLRMIAYMWIEGMIIALLPCRVVYIGPPGVYSPDVAGLYMGDQHMMRPPGTKKAVLVNYLLAVLFASCPMVIACVL